MQIYRNLKLGTMISKFKHSSLLLEVHYQSILEITSLINEERKKPDGFMEKNVCMALVEHMKNERASFGGG